MSRYAIFKDYRYRAPPKPLERTRAQERRFTRNARHLARTGRLKYRPRRLTHREREARYAAWCHQVVRCAGELVYPQSWTLADLTLADGRYYSDPDNVPGGGGEDPPGIYNNETVDVFFSPDGAGTFDGSSEGNAKAAATVYADDEIAPGTVLGRMPGVYTKVRELVGTNVPTWNLSSSGESGNPIIVVSKYCVDMLDQVDPLSDANRSEMRHTGPSGFPADGTEAGTSTAGPCIGIGGGINYVEEIGACVDEDQAYSRPDNGPCYFAAHGSAIRKFYILGSNLVNWADNHNGVRIGENSGGPGSGPNGSELTGGVIDNIRNLDGGFNNHNAACVMVYETVDLLISNNWFKNSRCGFYLKGTIGAGLEIGHNIFSDIELQSFRLDNWTGTSGGRVHHNLFLRSNFAISITGNCTGPFDIDFNTFYDSTVGHVVGLSGSIAGTKNCRNNLFGNAVTGDLLYYDQVTTPSFTTSDYNFFDTTGTEVWSLDGDDYTTLVAYRAASGQEANSSSGAANFLDPGASNDPADYEPQSGGALTASNTGGLVGCHQGGGQVGPYAAA